MTRKNLWPMASKNVASGLSKIIAAINLADVVKHDDALIALHYLESLDKCLNSDEYKARREKENERIKNAKKVKKAIDSLK